MTTFRERWLSAPLLRKLKQVMPPISDTERQALEAGGVWWDAQLLSGKPHWDTLLQFGKAELTERERAFIDGPVNELCSMIDDWAICFEHRDIPEPIWAFLKQHRFFGMIIPEQYGGLGFSAYAHSEVVTRISTCSTAVAVTVMVPNSLGPGELLMEFGTQAQKDFYLPRLADGRDIPCFGLTSPDAGSDAAAMKDSGVVCYGDYKGERVLGIRLNWHKRYITLGPVATVLGLAFKLYDPEHLLGDKEELGITVALVPTNTPGVEIGQRHYASMQAFQNGPNWGRDVFLPMDAVIGGAERVGQGWKMLMAALSAGRSISLPSMSTGGAKLAALATGAYARIREQFHVPIGKFEGVSQRLAQIASTAYVLEAARMTTTHALDRGEVPAVISAILKTQSTYRLRESINDAMDVHGGKTICDGPKNYLGNIYRSIPVAITVEGANILTQNLIIFGQGAIRCHPFLLKEMEIAESSNEQEALTQFDKVIFQHLKFSLASAARAFFHTWTCGLFAGAPAVHGFQKRYYQQLSRYSAVLTFVAEVALLSLGGALKRKEFISARLGDMLSELYLLSCTLKRFEDDGAPIEDKPIIDWSVATGLRELEIRLAAVIDNFPNRPLAWLMKFMVLPFGSKRKAPSDRLTQACADLLLAASPTRARLTQGVFVGGEHTGLREVQSAFERVIATQALRDRLKTLKYASSKDALAAGAISEKEAKDLQETEDAVARAIAVDHFRQDELARKQNEPVLPHHPH